MLAARSWLESPLTLNIVTALGTLLAGIGAIWVLIVAGPRYRLRYGPLTSQELKDGTWKVAIYLASRGRRDITRKAFDEDEAVELDIGVGIRGLGDSWTSKKSTRIVGARAEGTSLLVGPGLIGRDQDLRFNVIAEAKPTKLTCRASLIDVSIRRQFLAPRRRAYVAFAATFPVAFLASVVMIWIVQSTGTPVQGWVATSLGFVTESAALAWVFRIKYPED